MLTSGQAAALTQALAGLGGVGKTQLAVEYAYRHACDYDVVWWMRSEEPATLASDYSLLAQKLDLREKDEPDQRIVIQAVRDWLRQNGGWLLIFDNARDRGDLHEYCPQVAGVPQGSRGHILITSRSQSWRGVANPLAVQVLGREEAIEFLLKRTGQQDRAAAGQLAEALGGLPLALEQAGAFIEECGETITNYLSLFTTRQRELLQKGQPSPDYPATVATTWEISFQEVEKSNAAGAELLNLCAFFAPDDIPKDILIAGAEHLPPTLSAAIADRLAFDEAVKELRRYSLIDTTEDALSVHRLVQAVTRDRLSTEAQKGCAEAAVQIVNDAYPGGDIQTDLQSWPTCARLLPQALAVSYYAEKYAGELGAIARLLNQAAAYQRSCALYVEARKLHERALKIDEAVYGSDHPSVSIDVNNVGSVLRDLGDLIGAKACYERALKIDEVINGPDHPMVATTINNLGLVLRDLGDLAGARAAFERALKIDEAAYGPDHPKVAIRVNNLGVVLRDLGDLTDAKNCHKRALKIDEAVYGPDHPTVATMLSNLGLALQDSGDLMSAKATFERAFKIYVRFLGENHPDTMRMRKNLERLEQRMKAEG